MQKKFQICKQKKLFKKKNTDRDYFIDAIRQTVLEKNNELFYYFKKGLQGAAVGVICTAVNKKAMIDTISPLIRNRMNINNRISNLGFKVVDYRSRHFYFYGFLGGIGYDYFVNQERFIKNTPLGWVANHILFGGLFLGLVNLKYTYKGAVAGFFIGSLVSIGNYKNFKRRYPPGFKIQYKDIPEDLRQEILEKEKLEYLSYNTMVELMPNIDINGDKLFGYF